MHETPDDLERLQGVLDRSYAGAGGHLRSIITEDRRLSAQQVAATLTGMRLLALTTVTATDGTASDSQGFVYTISSPISLTNPGDQTNSENDSVSL